MNTLSSITIKDKIHILRNTEVMLDSDLALLYGVETKRINEAVIRNSDKFPEDFMFLLTDIEFDKLRSQIATTKFSMTRSTPKAFTEQGVYMLATVLKSTQATEVTISIMRTFTKLRRYALEHSDLSKQIYEMRQEIAQNKLWTKERMSAIADTIIILEESFNELKEMVSEIGVSKEVERIGFLRNKKIDKE
jgi:methyl-accepting chemotaxis protein